MKIAKMVIGTLIVLMMLFLLISSIVPKVECTTQIEVNKPVKEAWGVFQDESKAGEWITGLESIELVSGEKNEVGSIYKIKMNPDGHAMEMDEELINYKEFERFGIKLTGMGMKEMVDVRFEAKDDNTTVITADQDYYGETMMMRFMFALTKGSMQTTTDDMYAKLKTLIENNSTDYYPAPAMEADATAVEAAGEAVQ